MRSDCLYLGLLCAIILVTFWIVFLPQPAQLTLLPLHGHASVQPLAPANTAALTAAILLYLQIIWRLINPPSHRL